jgi:lipid-A-disaccharide synthase-like uncharacterized protein
VFRKPAPLLLGVVGVVCWLAIPVLASDGLVSRWQEWWGTWLRKVSAEIASPLFWFGLCAQAMFFGRFAWQWLVSEKRGHSTIPIAFWYFSLAGGLAMFLYGFLLPNLVIMLGQLLACAIYARNLMLIYGQAKRRQLAGLPRARLRSEVLGENDAESGF